MMRNLVKETISKTGERVRLMGWVAVRRDHGKIIFIDLRDRSGIIQLVFIPKDAELYKAADALRPEWVIEIEGVVQKRPKGMENREIETGEVEIPVERLEVLNKSETPPFDIAGVGMEIDEEIRLKYRYLDLRRPRLQKNLRMRAEFLNHIRSFLISHDFLEVETPMLTKSTPEGSRDFVVPSRLHPGEFYALPQSPQQYKQLLMVAGFERYFQIARALRDEDLRADRGFEHTQIDLEMSFVEREHVMKLVEEMVTYSAEKIGRKIKEKPFPIFTYKDAMEKFGADKFDLRSDREKKDGGLAFAWVVDFPVFEKTEGGGWTYGHNPFTGMKKEDEEGFLSGTADLEGLVSLQYDLVCNGHEVAGGGIRINRAEVLKKVFEVIGHTDDKIHSEFGHMLEAFCYGAPPHGGIALGVERFLMMLAGESYLREVQAFPMTSGGKIAVMDAPSELTAKQLKELNLKIDK
ncbi:MAG: aspartate--tRNA ligase [Candidatus Sungbacteria bacterium]|nr:aspartate--tRNA ligase [Candidatus Sungbacteria bacterium]